MNSTELCKQILLSISPTELFTPIIKVLEGKLSICEREYPLPSIGKIKVLGVGKAAASQVDSLYKRLSSFTALVEKLETALVLTKYDHSVDSEDIVCLEGGHPLCDQNSINNTLRAIDYVNEMKANDLLIACISGGASAIMTLPIPLLDLKDLSSIFLELLGSGASIEEINTIRKEISLIKNGGMAACLGASRAEILLVSDVSSNQIEVIGSGPFCFAEVDSTSVIQLANKYLSHKWVSLIETWIASKERKNLIETKLSGSERTKIHHTIISDFSDLMNKSKMVLSDAEFQTTVIETPLTSSIEDALALHTCEIKKMLANSSSSALISGGEVPITVRGSGQGGRNTEFALQLSHQIFYNNILKLKKAELKRITITCIGTDGTDGPTDYAGAYFDYSKFEQANSLNLDIEQLLRNNDSLTFFKEVESAIKTGPTGTNLMDLRMITVSQKL